MIKEQLDKIGVAGSFFAGLCCIGAPAVLAFLSAVGLGFLINDHILLPALFIFLGIAGWGMVVSRKRHGRKEPGILFGVSAAVIVITMWFSTIGVIVGMAGLISSSVMNIVFQRRCAT